VFLVGHAPPRETSLPRETVSIAEVLTGGLRCVEARRCLKVARRVVATMNGDPSRLTPLSAVSADGLPVVEVLAAVAASHPTGLLVLESTNAEDRSAAFAIDSGRVVGASTGGPLGRMETWVAEVHCRFPERFGSAKPAWADEARTFVRERLLEGLERSRVAGSRMVFLRGDVQWHGPQLAIQEAPALEHVLLEHARRSDEMPTLTKQCGDLRRVVVPLCPPPDDPSQRISTDDSWDLDDEPDPLVLAEWADVRALWMQVDGEASAQEIMDSTMLGEFRSLRALATLLQRESIHFGGMRDLPPPEPEAEEEFLPPQQGASVIKLPTAMPSTPRVMTRPRMCTEYSMVRRGPRSCDEVRVARVSTPARTVQRVPNVGPSPAARNPVPSPPTVAFEHKPAPLRSGESGALPRKPPVLRPTEPTGLSESSGAIDRSKAFSRTAESSGAIDRSKAFPRTAESSGTLDRSKAFPRTTESSGAHERSLVDVARTPVAATRAGSSESTAQGAAARLRALEPRDPQWIRSNLSGASSDELELDIDLDLDGEGPAVTHADAPLPSAGDSTTGETAAVSQVAAAQPGAAHSRRALWLLCASVVVLAAAAGLVLYAPALS